MHIPSDALNPVIAAESGRTERHLRMLRDLADMSMDFAREVHRTRPEATPPGEHPTANTPIERAALVFARLARCVRQTLALEARLAQDHRAHRAATDAIARGRAERRIRHDVMAAWRATPAAPPIEPFRSRLEACLADCTTEDDFAADRPVADITARICRTLRVAPPGAANPAPPAPFPPDVPPRIRPDG